MSRTTDLAIEMQEENQNNERNRKIAKKLGISYEELMSLNWEIDTQQSSDDMIYSYHITFDSNSPKEILSKIIGLGSDNSVSFHPWEYEAQYEEPDDLYDFEDEYDLYEDQFDAIQDNRNPIQNFENEVSNIKKLYELNISNKTLKEIFNRQIFISVIGTLETYLSDTFINLTFGNSEYFRNFIETFPDFKKRKFELKDIFQEQEKIKETAKLAMLDIIYHNIPTVMEMYKATFNINFPPIGDVIKHVKKRHDLVHRNGKTKKGIAVQITDKNLEDLINSVSMFVHKIEKNIKEKEDSL